jgi:site-specific recombinase XerC
VLPELGRIRLSQLHRRGVQRLVDRLVGLGLSGSRVRGALMPLRATCRSAIRNDEIMVNPTQNLDLPAVGEARDRVASPAEAVALLDALPAEDRPLWATAFCAGLHAASSAAAATRTSTSTGT